MVIPMLIAVSLALGIGGCALTAPVTCPVDSFDPPAPLSCDAAVEAARQRLASVADIASLRFEYIACAANARCVAPDGATGNVIATLGDGTELAVFVGIDPDGVVHAAEPELLTPEPQPAPGG
jgi:hypothetical protein